jgi:hypothetical protein
MPNNKLEQLVENFFKPQPKQEEQFSITELLSLISEVESNFKSVKTLTEQEGERFSVSIPLPKLTPTEAWGNPDNQSRKDVDRIFASITRQGGVKERIDHVNSFLDPKQAIKKAPGGKVNAVLNMLQIIEALQAALNDYNESSAGFVFEGFMAALTGGKQISGRVGGTLPIEDFITADGEQVSLKLLSPKTGIHGSFTNLIDYLFLRGKAGEPSIKYLVAYKDTEGQNVSKLAIYDFILSRENFVEAMSQSGNQSLFGVAGNNFKQHVENWEDSPEWRLQMAEILKKTPGYDQRRGMFIKNLDQTGNRIEAEAEGDEEEVGGKAGYSKRTEGGYKLTLDQNAQQAGIDFANKNGPNFEQWYSQNISSEDLSKIGIDINNQKKVNAYKEQLKQKFNAGSSNLSESYFGYFDLREKNLLNEAKVSSGEGGAQWSISGPALLKMNQTINTRFYGELNLSQANISELSKIYIDKIGKDLINLLQTTKEFTENIGRYFSAVDRSEAMSANKTAIAQGGQIITSLAADPTGTTEQPE